MFRIFLATMLVVITLTVPPLAFFTIPVLIIWGSRVREKRMELRAALSYSLSEPYDKARDRAIASW